MNSRRTNQAAIHKTPQDIGSRRLGIRLALAVLIISSLVTGIVSALELYRQYRMEINEIKKQFISIHSSMVPALTEAIWVEDPGQIRIILDGLVGLRYIESASVTAEGEKSWSKGTPVSTRTTEYETPLNRPYKDKNLVIGTLKVTAGFDDIYTRLQEKLFETLISNAVTIFLVVFFMIYLFQWLVGRHLQHIARHVIGLDPDRDDTLALERRPGKRPWRPDILDEVVNSVNQAHQTLSAQRMQLKSQIAKLRAGEKRYRSLVEQAADAIFIAGVEGKFREANARACEIFGYSIDEFKEMPVSTIFPEHATEHQTKTINRFLAGKRIVHEQQFRRKDGTLFPGEIVVCETGGGLLLAIVRDTSKRKTAEIKRLEAEQKYQALFENMTAGFVLFEVVQDDKGSPIDLVIIAANRIFEETTTLELKNVIGKRLTQVLPDIEKDDADWIGTYGKIALTGVSEQFEQFSEKLGYHYSIFAYHAGPNQCAVTFIDITERKKAEEDAENLQAELRQAQKMEAVGALAGGVAHDYNNMLSVILGYTKFALEAVDPESEIHADLMEVYNAANRSTEITRQLLAFARKQSVQTLVLDLNNSVEGLLKMIQRLIGEDIDLTWHPCNSLWPVNVDPAQIDQILVNLTVNARDAIADVGIITIETKNVTIDDMYSSKHAGFIPGDFVMLAVSDNGSGMEKETVDKIFEPFFTTKELGRGTGMGLATVYGIVKQNDGFINVYSEYGKGTTFKIYFKRHLGDVEVNDVAPEDELPEAQGETVLVVEDDVSILRLCQRLLNGLGYNVLTANSPSEAIDLAQSKDKDIHLLLTDVIMPEMNGKILTEHIKKFYPEIKVLFMSGYTANVIAHHGVLEKGIHFVSKPLSRKILAAKIREALK